MSDTQSLIDALHASVVFLLPDASEREELLLEFQMKCHVCGCDTLHPCIVPDQFQTLHYGVISIEDSESTCYWIQDDLCSGCCGDIAL